MPNDRGSHFMDTIGRLKSGITHEDAHADLTAILEQLKKEHTGKGWRVYTIPLYREMVGRSQRMLLVLLGAVGLLLLIACVNAANLLLARASARVREIAVRSALGAARGRIIRQLLTESLVIALAGAALGTLLAVAGVRVLVAFLPAGFPRASEIRLDSTVFAFTLVVAILTGLLFGLVPALTASRTDLQQSLRESGRSATGTGRQFQLRKLPRHRRNRTRLRAADCCRIDAPQLRQSAARRSGFPAAASTHCIALAPLPALSRGAGSASSSTSN